jgi:hypothetical protein
MRVNGIRAWEWYGDWQGRLGFVWVAVVTDASQASQVFEAQGVYGDHGLWGFRYINGDRKV